MKNAMIQLLGEALPNTQYPELGLTKSLNDKCSVGNETFIGKEER